jgi:DNA-binding response OmpR family regulator
MSMVLAVDDDADVLQLIRTVLELEGHTVLTATDGASALDRVREEHPDVVVLDVMMPGLDGFGVLAELKGDEDPGVSTIPVVMLTALADDQDRVRGGIEGALHYLTKPFVVDELVDAVADTLGGQPEPERRRRVQRDALERLAQLEKGDVGSDGPLAVRPRLTRLERAPSPTDAVVPGRSLRQRVAALSPKQRELLTQLRTSRSVSDAAGELGVSRSNVYASLHRIARKLGSESVEDLLALVRSGELDGPPR